MAKVTDGLKALTIANLVPEDDYEFRVADVRVAMGDNNWERTENVIVDPEDPSLATRRIPYLIGSPDTGDWRSLRDLLAAAQLEDVPDGEYGEGDTRNLKGVTFPGRINHRVGNRGLEAQIRPTIDQDWLNEVMNRDDGYEEEEEAPRRKKRKTTKKKTRR